ncbi:YdcF family protein [Pelagibacterium lentulum]|uniref:DUF218 domain-containing protein n=1 Tax=Pelagibacterium lentulum TaxID=2029865 RepID=A0A916R886_9HYPH|nr:YdcF family protein [Pelagibacterium lentulum]GGA43401.1 hypothetical protein GCM10011499_11240 [Pelagibacterium lentulum]
MFFNLSKLLSFFLVPSNILLLVLLVALGFWLLKFRKTAATLGIASIAGMVLAAWSPIGVAALSILEDRFPRQPLPSEISGIILLGGAVDTHISHDRDALTLNEAGERVIETRMLAERYPNAAIFLSGGGGHLFDDGSLTESELARQALIAAGVEDDRIEMEERSRNTCENARETAVALGDRASGTWLLVTSASHMPRAVGCFRAASLAVIPYPVDFRTKSGNINWSATASSGLSAVDLAAHEWIGLVTYRMAGLTEELFPSPDQ